VKQDFQSEFLANEIRTRKEALERVERGISSAIAAIADTRQGREFLWWLFEICGVFTTSYTGNSDTYFNEGRRAVGNEVLHRLVEVKPEIFQAMIKSGKTRQNEVGSGE
jgi:hypothetical protein